MTAVPIPYHLVPRTASVVPQNAGVGAGGYPTYLDGTPVNVPCRLQAATASEAQQWGREISRHTVVMWVPNLVQNGQRALRRSTTIVNVPYPDANDDPVEFRVVGAAIPEDQGSPFLKVLLEADDIGGVTDE